MTARKENGGREASLSSPRSSRQGNGFSILSNVSTPKLRAGNPVGQLCGLLAVDDDPLRHCSVDCLRRWLYEAIPGMLHRAISDVLGSIRSGRCNFDVC